MLRPERMLKPDPKPPKKLERQFQKAKGTDRMELRTTAQEEFNDAVLACLPKNVETLQQLANGLWVEEINLNGDRRVYREKPDRAALMFLLEHGIGKATAREKKTADPVIILRHHVPRPPMARPAVPQEVEEEEGTLNDEVLSASYPDERGFDDDDGDDTYADEQDQALP